jgi:mitochondrial fission process protein 1
MADNTEGDDQLREGPARFLAFASRATRLIAPYSQQARYLAFTSDFGEAARPVVRPKIVTASYAVTWLYVLGDVATEGYHQWRKTPEHRTQVIDKVSRVATFQLIASIALPFLVIHQTVKGSTVLLKRYLSPKYASVHKWGPSAVGLGVIPFLPVTVDHPTEHAVDYVFNRFDPFGVAKKTD